MPNQMEQMAVEASVNSLTEGLGWHSNSGTIGEVRKSSDKVDLFPNGCIKWIGIEKWFKNGVLTIADSDAIQIYHLVSYRAGR